MKESPKRSQRTSAIRSDLPLTTPYAADARAGIRCLNAAEPAAVRQRAPGRASFAWRPGGYDAGAAGRLLTGASPVTLSASGAEVLPTLYGPPVICTRSARVPVCPGLYVNE